MHLDPVDRSYLTKEELEIVYNKQFTSQRLEAVRDMFIFSCYTGLAYIDMKQLTEEEIVEKQDGSADALAAFELQAQEYKKVQEEFSDYMERLQDDIALKAEKFGHVEFYDARLQDGYSNAMATAANEVNNLDERRKPLATTNPLLAKESVLLPQPNVEDVTYEHLSLNLPSLAVNALDSVSQIAVMEKQNKQEYTPSVSEETKMSAILEEDDEIPPVPEVEDEIPEIPEDEIPEIPEDEIPEIPNQG